MDAQLTKKYRGQSLILITCFILIIGLSACSPSVSTPSRSFGYQVHVQAKNSGADVAGAKVRIEDANIPVDQFTDKNGIAIIYIDSSKEGQPGHLIVEAPDYQKYDQFVSLDEGKFPKVIQLDSEQSHPTPILDDASALSPTREPPHISSVSTSKGCLWIPYLNDAPTSPLNDLNCLNDLKDVGISGDEKQVSFFVNGGRLSGMYGVCLDISQKDNHQFRITVRDNIVSARFLVIVAPDTIPNKSSRGFRIQPEIQAHQAKEIYVKSIEYTVDGYDKAMDQIQAISDWKNLSNWEFDFVLQFNSSKVNTWMNETFPQEWQLTSPNRYLCFAYQATPTATQAAELEVHITFP
jgi:hypothetical protein